MTLEVVGFWILAVVLVASALAVVLTKNLFHSVLWLALALTGTAGIFLMLNAEFLAGVQILLYAGGVVTVVVVVVVEKMFLIVVVVAVFVVAVVALVHGVQAEILNNVCIVIISLHREAWRNLEWLLGNRLGGNLGCLLDCLGFLLTILVAAITIIIAAVSLALGVVITLVVRVIIIVGVLVKDTDAHEVAVSMGEVRGSSSTHEATRRVGE